jgi:peroxiredoxin family protein
MDKTTLIVFSDDLDKILAAFNIATGSAAMGMEVTMFFTFWGLNVIRKDKPSKRSSNWMKRLMGLLNSGGADRLKLSKFHMMGIGTGMMRALMKKSNMPAIKEMISLSKKLGVKIVACNTSMEIMGVHKEDLIPEVDIIAGVATYLENAKESKVNLFI